MSEETVIRCCAPTLAAIKTGSLFNCAFESKEDMTLSLFCVNAETKHMIIARLVERIEINHDYEVEIKFRISVEQYMRIAA